MDKKGSKSSKKAVEGTVIEEVIASLKGIHSANIKTDGTRIAEIHLLTNIGSSQAVKAARTAIYVKTGYLVDKDTIFKVARVSK